MPQTQNNLLNLSGRLRPVPRSSPCLQLQGQALALVTPQQTPKPSIGKISGSFLK